MNILIPHTWLLEHLKTNASPTDIQKALSLCGPSVERIYEKEGESVYDIEVTTNRVDSFSVRGIAREAATILPRFGFSATLIVKKSIKSKAGAKKQLPLPTIHNDSALCRRISAIVLSGVRHTPTPDWMAKRLRQIDQQVHDSVIDITNYITHEFGHPCHAFDYDKLMSLGGEIIVKEAKPGLSFQTLDGKEYTTKGGEVVFVNQTGTIIDLPGIMGTANSSVDDNTKTVLLLLESIIPKKIRFTSMNHSIRTVAAQINEKNPDPHLIDEVLIAGIHHYENLTQARTASDVFDDFPAKAKPTSIELQLQRVTDYLGIEIDPQEIREMLQSLGCQVSIKSAALDVAPPSFRPDIAMEADVIEEIARIYGYHNLPSALMDTAIPTHYPDNISFPKEERVQQLLANLGYQELYTYSLISKELAEQAGELKEHVKMKNPLTSDQTYLRRHILPSHLNLMEKQLSLSSLLGTFELANTYHRQKIGLPQEKLTLTILGKDFRTLRTTIESVLGQLFIRNYKIFEDVDKKYEYTAKFYHTSAIITLNDRVLGEIGYLDSGFVGAELNWTELLTASGRVPHYQPVVSTSPYKEDITFIIPKKFAVGPLLENLGREDLVTKVTLLDQYQDKITLRFEYWDPITQLDSASAEKIHAQVIRRAAIAGAVLP